MYFYTATSTYESMSKINECKNVKESSCTKKIMIGSDNSQSEMNKTY